MRQFVEIKYVSKKQKVSTIAIMSVKEFLQFMMFSPLGNLNEAIDMYNKRPTRQVAVIINK